MSKLKECLSLKIQCLKKSIQTELLEYNGFECLAWLNNCCSDLTCVCKYMHEISHGSNPISKDGMDLIFLSLRQLISCVMNLERISMIEQKENAILRICRQHFQERMIHCLSRLNTSMDDGQRNDGLFGMNESNFVTHMDHLLQTLAPLALRLSFDSNQKENISDVDEFVGSCPKIREAVELLLGQVLAYTCVVSKSDRAALNALCHRTMTDCIAFQEICLDDNTETKCTENDKRLKAQQLQNVLYNLDRLMNESFLRVFFTTFTDFMENPLHTVTDQKIHHQGSDMMDELIEKFDNILDRLIQIGNFGCAYSTSAKAKSNLHSCLASFEAISISLVPAVVSGAFERDATYFKDIWNDTVQDFRRSIQEIINTHALCMVLIDLMQYMLHESNESSADTLQTILSHCEILTEHIQLNAAELEITNDSPLKVHFDDFKMMMSECKACVKIFSNIDVKRIKKRFIILLSSIKKMAKAIAAAENQRKNEDLNDGEPFTFGYVTSPDDNFINKTHDEPNTEALSESMNVIVDLNEFIEKNDMVKKELTHRSNVFYVRKHASRKLPKFSMAYTDLEPKTFRRSGSNIKRSSKRTSLRVAMFKRQKQLDTQKFIADSMSQSLEFPADSLNLQITDILEQLSKYTTATDTA